MYMFTILLLNCEIQHSVAAVYFSLTSSNVISCDQRSAYLVLLFVMFVNQVY